jgi:hypothetical protein
LAQACAGKEIPVTCLDIYADTSQLRTLQRRVKQQRAEQARKMIRGSLHQKNSDRDVAAEAATSRSINEDATIIRQ